MHLVRSSTAEHASFDALFADAESAAAYLRDASGDTEGDFAIVEVDRCPVCNGTSRVSVPFGAPFRGSYFEPCHVCSHLGAE